MKEHIDNFFHTASLAGIIPGLERIRSLLDKLGNPQDNLRFIHIAGTNGKGSTGCYCNALLAAYGCKVGWFSTPHLVRRNESIRITNGQEGLDKLIQDESAGEISQQELLRIVQQLEAALQDLPAEAGPSEFEMLTAAALLHFSQAGCDIVILEAGMGGLEDATNVIERPEAVIITALGYDHSAFLGADITSITRHKSGIIKEGCPVWLYDPADAIENSVDAAAASELIAETCRQKGTTLHLIRSQDIQVLEHGMAKQKFCSRYETTVAHSRECYSISMPGVYQPMLALMAIRVCKQITAESSLSKRQKIALEQAAWPARLELCRPQGPTNGPVLLDGAHNPQGCTSLAESLSELLPGKEIIFAIGMLADKDIEAMLRPLLISDKYTTDTIICTSPHSPRAMDAYQLAQRVADLIGREATSLPIGYDNSYNNSDLVFYEQDADKAIRYALKLNDDPDKAICVFGSLYLAGAVREQLLVQRDTEEKE